MNTDEASDDAPQTPNLPQVLPAFTPVPREKERTNGWKPEVQRAFIEALAETGSVRAACARVSRSDHGAYQLRRHPQAEEFRRAWDAALDIALRRLEDAAMDRAINGVDVPVYSYGKLVGTRTTYNDRLVMFMLRGRAGDRFGGALSRGAGAKADNAVERMRLERHKKRWRREWDEQQAAREQRDTREIVEGINAKLSRMRANWIEGLRPHVRAAWEAFEAAEEAAAEAQPPEPLPLLPGVFWDIATREDLEERQEERRAEAEADAAAAASALPLPPLEQEAPPTHRTITLKEIRFAPGQIPTDGRAQPWP